jgi:hypothetical protein
MDKPMNRSSPVTLNRTFVNPTMTIGWNDTSKDPIVKDVVDIIVLVFTLTGVPVLPFFS